MEKPANQHSAVGEQLVGFDAKYFLVKERLVFPTTIQGIDQGNRALIVRETSFGTDSWFKKLAPHCEQDEHV
jgi:hypothetical protein